MELLLAFILIAVACFIVGAFIALPFALVARARKNRQAHKPLEE